MLEFEYQYGNKNYDDFQKVVDTIRDELDKGVKNSAVAVSTKLRRILNGFADEMQRRHSTPWPNGTTERTLSKRSGKGVEDIKKSVRTKNTRNLDGLEAQMSTGNFYMSVQEEGAVIRPKRAKYLTVPTPYALDSRGLPLRRSARGWDNTFISRSKKGNLIIFQKRGTGIIPLYVLKKEVRIPPRLGLTSIFNGSIAFIEDAIADSIEKSIDKALGK
jgi:hypothetical protein